MQIQSKPESEKLIFPGMLAKLIGLVLLFGTVGVTVVSAMNAM